MSYRIAWIEDDIPIIKDVVKPLQDQGYIFDFIRSIDEANNNMQKIKSADLILLDLIYPAGENHVDFGHYPGISFLRNFRNVLKIDTPVIIFTVVTNEDARAELEKLSVSRIVNKPVRPSELARYVNEILNPAAS